jgi:ATP-binding cassette subfamily B (MDR/TAP) protein 1
MTFRAGTTTFVIGRSGSGKSTLGQLLIRFYRATMGRVRLDGIPLEDLDVHWLREQITLVEQNSVLFNDSIRRNISLGKTGREATPEEVEQAITFAELGQAVSDLPDGLNTLLGMHGNNLSGGQRQRIALARARIRDTPVLILDESTSALDYITRSAVLTSIRAWRRGKTTIIITHDISQILPDDLVYIMDNAKVVQQGIRRVLETGSASAFQSFASLQESDESNEEDLPVDETDEILLMYDGSWNTYEASARYSSSTLFGQTMFSPFLSPRQSSTVVDNKNSTASMSWRLPLESEIGFSTQHRNEAKIPPVSVPYMSEESIIKSGQGSRLRSRPTPAISHHSTFRNVPDLRPTSLVFSKATQLDLKNGLSFRRTFHAKMERRRKRNIKSEESTGAVETLDIMHLIKSIWPMVGWSTRLAIIIAVFCAVVHSALTPIFGYVFSQLLSTFYTAGNQQQRAQVYALAILGIAVADGLAMYGFNALFEISAQTWANALKAEGMRRILFQPREFFDREENSVSRIAECLDQFGEEARNLPGRFLGLIIVIVTCMSIALTWSLVSCWKLTLMAIPCLAIMYCITRIYNAISNRWERFSNEADEQVGQVLHETFVNIKTVRCLVIEEVFRRKYRESTLNALRIGIKRSIYSGSIFGLSYSSGFFVTAFLFWWGAYIVSKGDFTPLDIIETFNILMLSIGHASHIAKYIPQINTARDAGSRLIRLARLPQDSHELRGTDQLFHAGDITLENVNFTYPARKDHQVLHNITFDIPRGSCTAIVGSSGSGKSTIAALLLKLYQTTTQPSGYRPEISISNHDIKRLHTLTLRSRIAMVSQTPVLFSGTIAENITYGLSMSSSCAKPNNIRAAAHAAGVADFIESLPQGYETLVGEGGTGLSGGQAQRIAIARALIREPDVLILDEATSALDVESASIIRDTIHQLVKDSQRKSTLEDMTGTVGRDGQQKHMTVIIITHAREMMAIASHIVVLDKGRVVEEGSFEELSRKRRGSFARFLRGEEVEVPVTGMD